MARISTVINPEEMVKLTRRAGRVGMTPQEAFKIIATKGVQFFLRKLIAPTK